LNHKKKKKNEFQNWLQNVGGGRQCSSKDALLRERIDKGGPSGRGGMTGGFPSAEVGRKKKRVPRGEGQKKKHLSVQGGGRRRGGGSIP